MGLNIYKTASIDSVSKIKSSAKCCVKINRRLSKIEKKQIIGFDDFCGSVGEQIDEFILRYEKSENTQFIGGHCYFKFKGIKRKCVVTAELFFQDEKDQFMEVSMSGSLQISSFTNDDGKITKMVQGIEAEISHP